MMSKLGVPDAFTGVQTSVCDVRLVADDGLADWIPGQCLRLLNTAAAAAAIFILTSMDRVWSLTPHSFRLGFYLNEGSLFHTLHS